MDASRQTHSFVSHGIIKTRRLNQTESFLLEERLRVLENRKSQKQAEISGETLCLHQQLSEIRRVRNKVGISVERRKLLRSQGFTIDARATNCVNGETVLVKRHSLPNMLSNPGTNVPKVLRVHTSEPTMGTFPHLAFQGAVEDTEQRGEEEGSETLGLAPTRARHQFRIIEPPSRPGSRRNFIQLSSDQLKNLKDSEDQSNKELLNPNLKLDYRGKILSSKLAKLLRRERSGSLNESSQGDDSLPIVRRYRSSSTSDVVSDHEPQICGGSTCNERQISVENDLELETKSLMKSKEMSPLNKEAWKEMEELNAEDKTKRKNATCLQRKLVSDFSNKLEVLDLGSSIECQVCQSNHESTQCAHEKTFDRTISENKNGQPSNEADRKLARSGPLTTVAFVEHGNITTDSKLFVRCKQACPLAVSHSVHEPQQSPRKVNSNMSEGDCVSNQSSVPSDAILSFAGSHTFSETSPKLRRGTVPGRFNSAQVRQSSSHREENSNEIVQHHAHDNNSRIDSKLSVTQLQIPSLRKSKQSVVSVKSERPRKDFVLAYDARPNRALSKGYVTMQMTVKGNQVKVHIPRFQNDANEPAVERAHMKASAGRLQPRLRSDKTE